MERFPSMPRYKKIKLITSLIPAYQRVVDVANLLGMAEPSEPAASNCEIVDDYLILRDSDLNSIADVYVGADNNLIGHVIFDDGTELSEHEILLRQGHTLTHGFIEDCRCPVCTAAKIAYAEASALKTLRRSSVHCLHVPVVTKLKVRGVSDRLVDKLRDARPIEQPDALPRIVGHFPMQRDGNVSHPPTDS